MSVLVVSVSIVKDRRVFMIKENKPPIINQWNFPSGRIEAGEDIANAAKRGWTFNLQRQRVFITLSAALIVR